MTNEYVPSIFVYESLTFGSLTQKESPVSPRRGSTFAK